MIIKNLILFMVGGAIASFGMCVGYRLPRHMNWITGRSQCTCCGVQLKFIDLLPVLSCLMLRAKCRYCGYYFGWVSFILETVVGILLIVVSNIRIFSKDRIVAQVITCLLCFVCLVIYEIFLFYKETHRT